MDERVQHRDLWGNSVVSQSQTQMYRAPVLLPRPGLGIMGSECLCFDPHTNNLFLSIALNSLATPSPLTKTLKWLFFLARLSVFKNLSTLLSVPKSHFSSLCLPAPARL